MKREINSYKSVKSNYETDSVILFINNEEWMYNLVCEWVSECKKRNWKMSYSSLLRYGGFIGDRVRTFDDVLLTDSRVKRSLVIEDILSWDIE